jgi:hypothetical protein
MQADTDMNIPRDKSPQPELTMLSVLVNRFNDLSEPSIADCGASGTTEEEDSARHDDAASDGRACVLNATWRRR